MVRAADLPGAVVPAYRSRIGRVAKDERAVFTVADADAESLLGFAPGCLVGVRSLDLVHPGDHERALDAWNVVLTDPAPVRRVRLRHRRTDGTWLWLDVTHRNLLADPDVACVLSDLVDVSEEMSAREDARAGDLLMRRLTEAVPVGLLHLSPAAEVTYGNERLAEMLGISVIGPLEPQLALLSAEHRERFLAAVRRCFELCQDAELQVEVRRAAGFRLAQVSLRVLWDHSRVEGVIGCVADVTASVQLRAELEKRATYDALTGCLNRASLLVRLVADLGRLGAGAGCAVLFLDLDGFKVVNDTHGHAAGDEALRMMAVALRGAARVDDAVGRFGGDEFVLVCPGVASPSAALELACAVDARLRGPGHLPLLRASIGVSWTDDPALPPDVLVGWADAAMYRAKHGSRRPVLSHRGSAAETALRRADDAVC